MLITSEITDHHNKYNKFEIFQELPKCHKDKSSKCCWKLAPVNMPDTGLPQTSHLLNKKKKKYM